MALRKGLTEVQAKRLVGTTEEELEADAVDLLASFGGSGNNNAGDEHEENEETAPVTRPQRRAANAGDPQGTEGGGKGWDVDAAADAYFASSGIGG